jgi:tetratricopeptide (TPR) repeat protein
VHLGKNENAHLKVGMFWTQQGRYDRVVEMFRSAVAENPADLGLGNSLAWVLATCPDAKYRDGAQAVRLAEPINEKTGKSNPKALDTLAAAYAEAGRFDEAAATAKRALAAAKAAGLAPLAATIEKRLTLYAQKKAYHESMNVNPK